MEKSLSFVIDESFKKFPEKVAIQTDFLSLTYEELEQKVHRIIIRLIDAGVVRQSRVIIEMKRCPDSVSYIMALIKMGAVYIPVDPSQPENRRNFIYDDSMASFRISKKDGEIHISKVREASEISGGRSYNDMLLYILYTSGTTGNPKGVKIFTHSVDNLLKWMRSKYSFSSQTKVLHKTALTFDASVWELLISFYSGGTLYLADAEKDKIPTYIINTVIKNNINTIQFAPSMLGKILAEPEFKDCKSLNNVFCGGEALTVSLAKKFFELSNALLHNLYGPTETTIQVLTHTVEKSDLLSEIPIGRPIDGINAYIVTADDKEAAVGETGELCISGTALASGYVNHDAEEKRKFVTLGLLPEAPMVYRTGDLAFQDNAGNIYFCGRMDDEIKINGYRVNLNEIESLLNSHPSVDNSIVIKDMAGSTAHLKAYIKTRTQSEISYEAITSLVEKNLPYYMWPTEYSVISDIPLTTHGKADRKAVSECRDIKNLVPGETPIAPVNAHLESSILTIWQDVLNNKNVCSDTDFFSCGGNSIEAMIIAMKLKEQKGLNISLEQILQLRSVRNIVNHIQ